MRLIGNIILLFFLCCLFAACSTTHVYVCDSETKEPIEGAFIYINEYKMFNPFNSSNIYLSGKDGRADISETLRDGQVSIYAGKEGYPLNVFSRDFKESENVKLFLEKKPLPKIEVLVREPLLTNKDKQKLLKDFYLYCKKQNIKFYKLPGWKELSLE